MFSKIVNQKKAKTNPKSYHGVNRHNAAKEHAWKLYNSLHLFPPFIVCAVARKNNVRPNSESTLYHWYNLGLESGHPLIKEILIGRLSLFIRKDEMTFSAATAQVLLTGFLYTCNKPRDRG